MTGNVSGLRIFAWNEYFISLLCVVTEYLHTPHFVIGFHTTCLGMVFLAGICNVGCFVGHHVLWTSVFGVLRIRDGETWLFYRYWIVVTECWHIHHFCDRILYFMSWNGIPVYNLQYKGFCCVYCFWTFGFEVSIESLEATRLFYCYWVKSVAIHAQIRYNAVRRIRLPYWGGLCAF